MKSSHIVISLFLLVANLYGAKGQTAQHHDTLSSFLAISDIHLHANANVKEANGDSDDSLWMLARKEIVSVIAEKKPHFLIVLGDLPFHANCNDTNNLKEARKSFDTVMTHLNGIAKETGIPVITLPGNNDSWNGDYKKFFLPDSIFDFTNYPLLDYPKSDSSNKASLINATHLKEGYYSLYPNGKQYRLRIVCMNTTMFAKVNYCSYDGNEDSDANTQLDWLAEELQNARDSGEHVLIATHIPPGIDGYKSGNDTAYMWYSSTIVNRFLNLIHDYRENIIGLLASHTHMDGIRILRNDNRDSITSMLISVPGIAPGHGNNPAIKLIEYDPNNFALKNFVTYYMDYWNPDTAPTLKGWDSSFIFSKIAPVYDSSSMNMLEYFRKSCDKNCLDQIIDSIYTVKSKKRKTLAETKSKYVDYEGN
jgi:sphingomyelin phosphodiesterase acid-like 3